MGSGLEFFASNGLHQGLDFEFLNGEKVSYFLSIYQFTNIGYWLCRADLNCSVDSSLRLIQP